ncbi:DUF6934 family protein [Spirosoma fluviale]|uniref:Uncharacterized protein n=1 Tax=Spirosoma fluviale TaxID=1597977 RepID=A0A286FYS2_9BACT|nr:hypothetical protein [Spirosoma fluviale]SOD88393.1 hypothetical protein SAMN06269250_2645 [Spirosoma fluviale]
MNQPFYQFTTSKEVLRFNFISVGHRTIHKVIIYQKLPPPNLYNLVLADIDKYNQLDDFSISDNGDRDKILATVIQTMFVFFEQYPNASVSFVGSTPARTRLYQAAIARELDVATQRLAIYGLVNGIPEPFERNKSYSGFVIFQKHL